MTDFLLILVIIALFAFGFFVMWKWDRLLDKIKKAKYEKRGKPDSEGFDKKD